MSLKAKAGLTGKNPSEVLAFVRNVQVKLALAAAFASMAPSVTAMNLLLLELADWIEKMSGREPVKEQRDQTLKNVRNLFNEQVAEVNKIAQGNAILLGETGMLLVKPRSPRPAPGIVAKLLVENTQPSGSLRWFHNGAPDARCYYIETTTSPEDPLSWHRHPVFFGKEVVTSGHAPGSLVYGRVMGVNGKNQGPYSALTSIRVA